MCVADAGWLLENNGEFIDWESGELVATNVVESVYTVDLAQATLRTFERVTNPAAVKGPGQRLLRYYKPQQGVFEFEAYEAEKYDGGYNTTYEVLLTSSS